jgi:hypothetical protein
MAASKRKIGIYFTSGVAIAVIMIAAIFASGIQLPFDQNRTGTLSVSIKDAPVDLTKLVLTVDALYISNSSDNTWTELTLKDQPMTFDLLQLTGDNSLKLSEQTVLAGDYKKIRLDVTKAIATYIDNKGAEHTDETLKVPSSHIDIITSFSVDNNKVTGLLIDMQPDTTAISQSGNFRPIVKMTVTPQVEPTPTPTSTITPTPT